MPQDKIAAAAQLQYWWLLAIVVFLVLVPLAVSWTNKRQERKEQERPENPEDHSTQGKTP